jgi:hypothetical protein
MSLWNCRFSLENTEMVSEDTESRELSCYKKKKKRLNRYAFSVKKNYAEITFQKHSILMYNTKSQQHERSCLINKTYHILKVLKNKKINSVA